jgi:uncharacterized membrane protein YeaQ/YmgE (transglycosylase-associated protein family)
VITFLAFGILIGALARMSAEGEETGGGMPLILALLTGVAGALSGAYFGRIVGLHDEGEPAAIVMSLATATLFAAIGEIMVVRERRRHVPDAFASRIAAVVAPAPAIEVLPIAQPRAETQVCAVECSVQSSTPE